MRVLVVPDETAERVKASDPNTIEVPVSADMEDLVARLMPAAAPRVPDAGWTEQARRNAQLRERFLAKFNFLDAAEVAQRSGSRSTNRRAAASRWASSGRVFGVKLNGQVLYPAFQFDEAGQPLPSVAEALEALRPLGLSDWAQALWWDTASDVLGWRTPAEVVGEDPAAVVDAAQLDASTLGS